jgi:hypothetical protein
MVYSLEFNYFLGQVLGGVPARSRRDQETQQARGIAFIEPFKGSHVSVEVARDQVVVRISHDCLPWSRTGKVGFLLAGLALPRLISD